MILFPRQGQLFWYITDLYERLVAIPVIVCGRKASKQVREKYEVVPASSPHQDLDEAYEVSRHELYGTWGAAEREMARMSRKARRKV